MEIQERYLEAKAPKETQLVHQPVVICIDTSGSMNGQTEDGRTKLQLVEDLVNDLATVNIKEVDICIITFDSTVQTVVEWRSIADFDGGLHLKIGGYTSLGSAFIEAVKKTRERREIYNKKGIASKRAQIFLYTDGASTENLEAAYKLSQEYLNREKPSAKMYGILIPPAVDPEELKGFGQKVTILAAKDCVNGLPAAFEFMQGSIVNWSSTTLGETVTQTITNRNLGVVSGFGGASFDPNTGMKKVEDYVGGGFSF